VSTEATGSKTKPTPRKRGTSTQSSAEKAAVVENVESTDIVPVDEVIVDETASSTTADETEILEGELISVQTQPTGMRMTLGANDNRSTMFTERTAPWMKLGRLVDGVRTARDAAIQGGIDFDVVKAPAGFFWEGQWVELTDRKTIVRKDTGTPMSVVSDGYPVLQYSEAFNFMDQINPEYIAAGALKGGKQGFMVVKTPNHFDVTVLGEDKHEFYVVLRTSHDLTRAVEIMIMPLRGKCMNQLTLRSLTRGVEHRWSVRHTTTMNEKLEEAQRAIHKMGDYVSAFKDMTERLALVNVSEVGARALMKQIFPDRPRTHEKIDRIINMWNTSETVAYPGTGWGLVNAVGEYYDWERSGGSAESRFTAALQGQTHTAINQVAARVLAMA
jgi:phage/plasmid-like protein (TIGR03299 family)